MHYKTLVDIFIHQRIDKGTIIDVKGIEFIQGNLILLSDCGSIPGSVMPFLEKVE
jgi:hypothetical protein